MSAENLLKHAASAYLRSASQQPVVWQPWGGEAFAQATREGKPVLLDIGAVWCHWCHVMDRESYEDPATAALINEHFIAVKVDRDERPDVDTRYQAAVQAISGQGGWPLTAFLTPQGEPYFGGTYFPPEERYGRPSFQRVLLTMAEAFQQRRDEVDESASSVMSAIEESESFSGRAGELAPELLDKMIASILEQFDERNGGFGSQPKFPHCAAIDLLIDSAARGGPHAAQSARAVQVTLKKMADGGMHDQLAGGFHRYSVDEHWGVPHFEKMAYDNSELLKNYVHAYQTFGDPEFARVARESMRWMDAWLTDREHGGFYASQDADDSLDDDGDYFTWTRAEARAVLSPEEFAVAAELLNIREVGDMHHNTAKNVLNRKGAATAERAALFAEAKRKMYAARLARKTPFIDRTIYTGWNAMCVSAYLTAGRVLGEPAATRFALLSLERALSAAWDDEAGLAHVVAYGDGVAATERVAAVLEDYGFLGHACLDAWEATGEPGYYQHAKTIADVTLERFYDEAGGGFFDTEQLLRAPAPIGALRARRKPLQDAPTPAGNPVAAGLLFRLEALGGERGYRERAEETLKTFGGIVEHFGLYAASFGQALVRMLQAPVQVSVVGDDAAARELESAALARFTVNKSVVRLPSSVVSSGLPASITELLTALPAADESFALVCHGNRCLPPIKTAEALVDALRSAT